MHLKWSPFLSLGIAAALVLGIACAGGGDDETAAAQPQSPAPAASAAAAPAAAAPEAMTPKRGGIARFVVQADPSNWKPVSRMHYVAKGDSYPLVYTRLFQYSSDTRTNCVGQLQTRALESWRWVDATTAEFTLKKGMKYHNKPPVNGREVVAEDVAYSFGMLAEHNKFQKPLSGRVESIEAVDRYTFRVKTKIPYGGLIADLLGNRIEGQPIIPPEVVGQDADKWDADPQATWIGSGPFMFDKWEPGVKTTFQRHPDYFIEGKPHLDGLEMLVVPDVSTSKAMIRSGQLDILYSGVSEELALDLSKTIEGLEVVRCPDTGETRNVLWLNNSGPPFDNVQVRRAVSMAIDRDALKKAFFDGHGTLRSIIPPGFPFYVPVEEMPASAREVLTYNPEKARQLLKEAGYPNGFDTVLNYNSTYPYPSIPMAEAMAEMLNDVGIRTKLNLAERARWLETVVRAKYPIGEMGMTSGFFYGTESGLGLQHFWSGAGTVNRSIVNDPEYDAVYNRFVASTDEAERQGLARDMQVMALEKSYRVFMFSPDELGIVRPGLHVSHCCRNTGDLALMFENMWME